MIKRIATLLGVRSDFEQLFFLNEYQALAGKNKGTIIVLIVILFFTLLALSFAVGSIQNLSEKMDDPFTNWVNWPLASLSEMNQAKGVEQYYNQSKQQETFELADVRGWTLSFFSLFPKDYDPVDYSANISSYTSGGRTLESEDPLWEAIINPDNLVWINKAFDDEATLNNCEIIISSEMLEKLGYNPNETNLNSIFAQYDYQGNTFPFALNIVGVVRKLPRLCDFICAPVLYNFNSAQKVDGKNCSELIEFAGSEAGNNFTFIAQPSINTKAVKEAAREFFKGKEAPEVSVNEYISSGEQRWGICEIAFMPAESPTTDSIKLFMDYAKQQKLPLRPLGRLECETDDCAYLNDNNYHNLSFNFSRLGNIRKFQSDIKENYNVEIDMSQVEAKENFALVAWLTWIISLGLLGFGILSIILFVNSLLSAHLFQVRSNLGTFKAFGLSDRFLNSIYLKIIFSFLLIAMFIAGLGAVVIDRVEQWMWGAESKINLFSFWILIAMVLVVVISLLISSRTIKNILGDTPGNLIYGR